MAGGRTSKVQARLRWAAAALAVIVLVLLIVNYELHSRRSADEHQDPSAKIDLRHFALMNDTLTALNHELKQIRLHRWREEHGNTAQPPPPPPPLLLKPPATPAATRPLPSPPVVAALPQPPPSTPPPSTPLRAKKKALLYTMDSISSYEEDSRRGGASGEVLIRRCLERAFHELGVALDVKTSDRGFDSADAKAYDIIILDPWTWAAPGWVPKPHIRGLDDRIYILDFFGAKTKLRGAGMKVPGKRFLTAFDTSSDVNTFLGYFMEPAASDRATMQKKKQQGVVWGKDTKHFDGRQPLLSDVANKVHLVSTATAPPFQHANIRWAGHQTPEGWASLLRESRFLVGLGDPLLGPSAVDAVAAGCMFLNPRYPKPVRDGAFHSQHPYAERALGKYVCSYQMNDAASLLACVDKALNTDLPPFIPPDFTKDAYLARVKAIFSL